MPTSPRDDLDAHQRQHGVEVGCVEDGRDEVALVALAPEALRLHRLEKEGERIDKKLVFLAHDQQLRAAN